MIKRRIKAVALLLGIILVVFAFRLCWLAFPIATGYSAKVMCSGIFVSDRNATTIASQDLGFFPVRFVKCSVNPTDSSVTCSLLGLATKKAIYRQGLGATLVNDLSEKEIRNQKFLLPQGPPHTPDTANNLANAQPGPTSTVDTSRIVDAVNKIFSTEDHRRSKTRALIVVYNGSIVCERYAPEINGETRLAGWSMTKSVTGALAGIMQKEGTLNLNEPVGISEWQKDERRHITIKHLLQQTSGLAFEEVYERPAHANTMLFVAGNAARYAAARPLQHKPGARFEYSSGNTNILSAIMRKKLGDSVYYRFPYKRLFHKIGMYNTVLEPDPSGTFVGSSFCYATARDWARFGLLFLNNGKYNGEEILSEEC